MTPRDDLADIISTAQNGLPRSTAAADAIIAAGWVHRNLPTSPASGQVSAPTWEDLASVRHALDAALNTPCFECGHS